MNGQASPPASNHGPNAQGRQEESFLRENWQAVTAAVFGIAFVCVLLAIALVVDEPKPFSLWVFRVVLSLAAAGVGAVIPGLIHLDLPFVRAAGAIALFVLVYRVNPPELVQPNKAEVTPPAITSGVPLSAVADLILGVNPSETRSSQEALLRRTLADLTISVPLVVGSEETSNECSEHRTVFLQSANQLVKLQTFAVPAGHLRVRGLSDGQQRANLVTAHSFVAVSDAKGFRRVNRTTKFKDVSVYEFETTAPSTFFIASYYPGVTAFSQGADEVGVEISDVCKKVDVLNLAFAAVPFEEIEFRHAYEAPAHLPSPPMLKPFPDDRIESARSAKEETKEAFGAFVQFIHTDTSDWTSNIVKTWELIVDGNEEKCVWESRRYRGVTGDLLVVARGRRSQTAPKTDAVAASPKAS
jgi:hypothetical protein